MPSKKHNHFFVEHLRAYQVAPAAPNLQCKTKTFEDLLDCSQKLGVRKIEDLNKKQGPDAVRAFQDKPVECKDALGTSGFYRCRILDFKYRNPKLKIPPYYPDYGDKYVHRFKFETMNNLSANGKEWLRKTLLLLQQAIDNKLRENPAAFADLERNPEKLQAFAYKTHPEAYLQAGLENLSVDDLLIIGRTPDAKDLWTRLGIAQVIKVAEGLIIKKVSK